MSQKPSPAPAVSGDPSQLPYENPFNKLLPPHFDASVHLVPYSSENDDDPITATVHYLQDTFRTFVTQRDPPLLATISLCTAYTGAAKAMDPVDPRPSP